MGPLDGAPGIVLHFTELRLFCRMPSNGSGIREDVRSLQRRQPRAFGVPLIPADECANAAVLSVKSFEAEIARREVELLVVQRIVGNVHLAVDSADAAIAVERNCGVVVNA